MRIRVNGQDRDVDAELTLAQLLAGWTAAPNGVAAAVNESVVPRSRWGATALCDGDRVEILTAVQGG